jgi:hypothetical protein
LPPRRRARRASWTWLTSSGAAAAPGEGHRAKGIERQRLAALHGTLALVDGGQRLGIRRERGIRHDRAIRRERGRRFGIGGLIHWDEDGRQAAVTGDDAMLLQVGHLIDDLAELSTNLADGNGRAGAPGAPHGHHIVPVGRRHSYSNLADVRQRLDCLRSVAEI